MSFFFGLGGGYRILDTDYDSYAVVYSCGDYAAGAYRTVPQAWVLVRDKIEDGSAEFDAMMVNVADGYT